MQSPSTNNPYAFRQAVGNIKVPMWKIEYPSYVSDAEEGNETCSGLKTGSGIQCCAICFTTSKRCENESIVDSNWCKQHQSICRILTVQYKHLCGKTFLGKYEEFTLEEIVGMIKNMKPNNRGNWFPDQDQYIHQHDILTENITISKLKEIYKALKECLDNRLYVKKVCFSTSDCWDIAHEGWMQKIELTLKNIESMFE